MSNRMVLLWAFIPVLGAASPAPVGPPTRPAVAIIGAEDINTSTTLLALNETRMVVATNISGDVKSSELGKHAAVFIVNVKGRTDEILKANASKLKQYVADGGVLVSFGHTGEASPWLPYHCQATTDYIPKTIVPENPDHPIFIGLKPQRTPGFSLGAKQHDSARFFNSRAKEWRILGRDPELKIPSAIDADYGRGYILLMLPFPNLNTQDNHEASTIFNNIIRLALTKTRIGRP